MRSQKFHPKSEKASPIVVDEASRLTLNGAEQINVYQVDDDGKKCGLLSTVQPGAINKIKLNNINEILLESKGDFQSIIEGPEKLDNTPIEVPVERPLTQTQQLKMWLQNENNIQAQAKGEMSWDDFKDLGDLDDGDEFYKTHQAMTRYEMQAEMMRQEANPNRGNPITDKMEKDNAKTNASQDAENKSGSVPDGGTGQTDNQNQQENG